MSNPAPHKVWHRPRNQPIHDKKWRKKHRHKPKPEPEPEPGQIIMWDEIKREIDAEAREHHRLWVEMHEKLEADAKRERNRVIRMAITGAVLLACVTYLLIRYL
jgi:hypothetical protein